MLADLNSSCPASSCQSPTASSEHQSPTTTTPPLGERERELMTSAASAWLEATTEADLAYRDQRERAEKLWAQREEDMRARVLGLHRQEMAQLKAEIPSPSPMKAISRVGRSNLAFPVWPLPSGPDPSAPSTPAARSDAVAGADGGGEQCDEDGGLPLGTTDDDDGDARCRSPMPGSVAGLVSRGGAALQSLGCELRRDLETEAEAQRARLLAAMAQQQQAHLEAMAAQAEAHRRLAEQREAALHRSVERAAAQLVAQVEAVAARLQPTSPDGPKAPSDSPSPATPRPVATPLSAAAARARPPSAAGGAAAPDDTPHWLHSAQCILRESPALSPSACTSAGSPPPFPAPPPPTTTTTTPLQVPPPPAAARDGRKRSLLLGALLITGGAPLALVGASRLLWPGGSDGDCPLCEPQPRCEPCAAELWPAAPELFCAPTLRLGPEEASAAVPQVEQNASGPERADVLLDAPPRRASLAVRAARWYTRRWAAVHQSC